MYNKSYAKLEDSKTLRFAPSGVDEVQLLADGWLPVVNNSPSISDDDEYISLVVGFKEVDNHIEKDYIRRKRSNLLKKYSKKLIIDKLGDNYELFSKELEKHSELLDAFNSSSIYIEDCDALKQCMQIYCEITGKSREQIISEVLSQSVIE